MQNEHDELFYLWIWRNLKCNRLWCLLYLLVSQAGNHRASRFHAGRLRVIYFHGWDTTLSLNSICLVKIQIAKVEMCIIPSEKRWSHNFCTKKAREAKKNPINWNLWWIQDAPFFDGISGLIWVELCIKAAGQLIFTRPQDVKLKVWVQPISLPPLNCTPPTPQRPCNTGLEYNIEIQQPHISKFGHWDLQGPWGNNIRGVQVLGTTENQWSPGAVHYLSHCLIATARTKKAEHRQIILSFRIWHCVLSSVQLVAAVGSFNGHRRHKS